MLQNIGFIGRDRELVRSERLVLPDPAECQSVSFQNASAAGKSRTLVKKGDHFSDTVVLKFFTNVRKQWQQRQSHA
jgi:hypothetical protein